MAQSVRTRLLRLPKQEQELRVLSNPTDHKGIPSPPPTPLSAARSKSPTPSNKPRHRPNRVDGDDYVAPPTAHSLRPNSRWLIVRRNLHRIRFMGHNARARDSNLPDFYIGLQMKRELKRAQEEIKNIDREENFHAVKQFSLAVDSKRTRTYDTSHVKAGDALIYDRLGDEPLSLQNLLYYFSKQEVPHGTLFWDFLNEVNRVLNMKKKRTERVERFRKLALVLAVVLYIILGTMFFLLVVSVITTATRMNDPEVHWMEPSIDAFSRGALSRPSP